MISMNELNKLKINDEQVKLVVGLPFDDINYSYINRIALFLQHEHLN